MKLLRGKVWSLSLRPASIAIGLLVAFLLGDSAIAIVLGARTAQTHRDVARIRYRLDSLSRIQEALVRKLRVRDALVEASKGRITGKQASILSEEIDRNAQLYHFDPLLILAVVLTESHGNFLATGRFTSGEASGAVGVMQVKPSTARATAIRMGLEAPDREDLFDPALNLTVGVAYLLQMIHRYGDLRLGIMAYNVGETILESGLRGEARLPEDYYRRVLQKYQQLLRVSPSKSLTHSYAGTLSALANSNSTPGSTHPEKRAAYV